MAKSTIARRHSLAKGHLCYAHQGSCILIVRQKICTVCLFRDEDFPDMPRAEVTKSESQLLAYKALPDFIDCKEVECEE